MKENESVADALNHAERLVNSLGRVAIDIAAKTAAEQTALREQVGKLQTRNEQLVNQVSNLQRDMAIEKSKAMPILKTLARIKVIADEVSSEMDIAELRQTLAEIKENLTVFINCNGNFNRYVTEYTAERATIKTAIAAKADTTKPPQ